MNFYEIQAFIVLSQELHFGKAAEKMNLSPSALSRVITRLEDEMNVVLFDRNNRCVVLTEEGKIFLDYANDFIQKKKDLEQKFSENNGEITGILKVYASVTACYTILPDFIKRLNDKFPKIQLSIETGDPAAAITAIRENKVGLAVAALPEKGLSGMQTLSILKTPLVYAAGKNSPFIDLEGSPQDILSSVPLILPKTGLARTRFDKWIKSRNVKPIIAAETEGNEAILAIAQLGIGIGLVPQLVLENGPYRGEFVQHSLRNILGFYDVGFILKEEISGTGNNSKIHEAVRSILSQM